MAGRRSKRGCGAVHVVDSACAAWQRIRSSNLLVVAVMRTTISFRALWWAIRAHQGQQWPEGHFTRSQVERGAMPYGTIIVFG